MVPMFPMVSNTSYGSYMFLWFQISNTSYGFDEVLNIRVVLQWIDFGKRLHHFSKEFFGKLLGISRVISGS